MGQVYLCSIAEMHYNAVYAQARFTGLLKSQCYALIHLCI